jgi:hypothetical protein
MVLGSSVTVERIDMCQLFGAPTQAFHSEGASLKVVVNILPKTNSLCLLGFRLGVFAKFTRLFVSKQLPSS